MISNEKYLERAKQLRKDAVNKLIQVALNFINENDNTEDFSRYKALKMLVKFRNNIKEAQAVPELNLMEAIHNYFVTTVKITYLYNSKECNGKDILDFTVQTGKNRSKAENKDKSEYIKQNKGKIMEYSETI